MRKITYILFLLVTNIYAQSQDALYDYDVEERLVELGISLQPPTLPPGLNIELATKSGNLVYLSGNGPSGESFIGKVGKDLTIEQGYQAARSTAINHISVLKAEIGDLNKVVKIVKVLGLVNATTDFTEHPKVINGYTDLMVEVFGERGKHARSAMGMGSLPWNLACEVEAIVEVIE
ncbi:MAG: RidA family protein [Eudoraea sp.]|nr:RidA family protein [Eudoraea sp.]